VPDIRSTWTNLIDQTHRKALADGQNAPWEAVALKVEDLGHRTNLNDNVFPVNIVLQLLLQYDLEFYVHDANAPNTQNLALNANLMWPIDVFIKINAPFENLVATLEALWYAQEQPLQDATASYSSSGSSTWWSSGVKSADEPAHFSVAPRMPSALLR